MCDAIHKADGLIWSSPMYKGTISGSFKNALDWLKQLGDRNPPYLTDKVVGLISTAGGMQGLQAVNTMEFVVRALRGWAVPLVMPIAQAWKAFDKQGVAQDAQLTAQLHALGREVARGSCQFALQPPTKADAAKAETEMTPLSDEAIRWITQDEAVVHVDGDGFLELFAWETTPGYAISAIGAEDRRDR